MLKRLLALATLALLSAGCSKAAVTCPGGAGCPAEIDLTRAPERFCPGQDGCRLGNDDHFFAGVGKRDLSPTAFEVPLEEYLDAKSECAPHRCGELVDPALRDCGSDKICPHVKKCGTDKLCPGDANYVSPDADGSEVVWKGPDADGSEKDGVLDFFRDCGRDRLCPGDKGYTAPDADGSEKNGKFDGFWLAGYQNTRPMLGIHDPIWARAWAVRNGDVTVAQVVIDAVGVFYEKEVITIRKKLKDRGVDVDYVMVSATHVHEAPDTLGQWGIFDAEYGIERGTDDVWLDTVTTKAAEAVEEAVKTMVPAKARFAVARTGFDGWVRDSRDPIIYDDRIMLMQLIAAEGGATIGTVMTYSSHPETVSDWNNLSTSDYPNYTRNAIEQGLPAAGAKPSIAGVGGQAIFVSGAVGGLITTLGINVTSRSGVVLDRAFEKCQAQGENVAEAALLALQTGHDYEAKELPISFKAQTLKLPMDNIAFRVASDAFHVFTRPTYDLNEETGARNVRSEAAVITIGPATFVGMPGEMFPEMTVGFDDVWSHGKTRIRPENPNPPDLSKAPKSGFLMELFKNDYVFPCGLTNDEVGYFTPAYDYKLHPTDPFFSRPPGDHYEETNGLGPETLPRLMEVYNKLAPFSPPLRPGFRDLVRP